MGLKTFTVEIRCDFADEAKHEAIKQQVLDAGRTLLATAMLLAEKRKPQVAVFSSDFYAGSEELPLEAPAPAEG